MDAPNDPPAIRRVEDVDAALFRTNLGIAMSGIPLAVLFAGTFGIAFSVATLATVVFWIVGVLGARRILGLRRWNGALVVVMFVACVAASLTSGGSSSAVLCFAGVIAVVARAFFPHRRSSALSGVAIVVVVTTVDLAIGRPLSFFTLMCATVVSGYFPFIAAKFVDLEIEQRRRAVIDQLTGCLNRHALATRIPELEAHAMRTDDGIAVITFDLDHFKRVNDDFGHAAGDRVLEQVTYLARKHLRRFELFYRLGGEEFALLLPGAEIAFAEQTAERLRALIEADHVNGIAVTASFGVAASAAPFVVEDVLAAADQQLYRAKENGRNRVCTERLVGGAADQDAPARVERRSN